MVKAVREHKRVLQTGSHYRSSPDDRLACELVRNGRIGQVKRILTYVAEQQRRRPRPGLAADARARGLRLRDVARPRPEAPYHNDRCFYRFRFNLDYSGGQTTNFGAHSNDIAQWGTGHGPHRPGRVRGQGSRVAAQGQTSSTRPPRWPSAPAMPTAWN